MLTLGIDIGTTTISFVVLDENQYFFVKTTQNDSFLKSSLAYEKIQDAHRILTIILQTIDEIIKKFPTIERIGITGQQHGIVYLDEEGNLLTPLYTWQDGRGNLFLEKNKTYAAELSQITGYKMASGFGLTTHYYHVKNHIIPPKCSVICTIGDYIAMVLAKRSRPLLDASNAASLGLFNVQKNCFDEEALLKANINPTILPELTATKCIGFYLNKIKIYVAIGDNQASFIGCCKNTPQCMLLNIGTGSQVSIHSQQYIATPSLETRPYPLGGYLCVGSSLCGGKSYALLEEFFRKVVKICTNIELSSCYDAMEEMLKMDCHHELPIITPFFLGTREDSSLKGSIQNLSINNFQPEDFAKAMLHGMVNELYQLASCYKNLPVDAKLYGAGNGLRKNIYLQHLFEDIFQRPLILSDMEEEAACGAAYFTMIDKI